MGFILHDKSTHYYLYFLHGSVLLLFKKNVNSIVCVVEREKPFSCDFELLLHMCHCDGMADSLCYKQIFSCVSWEMCCYTLHAYWNGELLLLLCNDFNEDVNVTADPFIARCFLWYGAFMHEWHKHNCTKLVS